MQKEIYTPDNAPLFEAMYGPGLISLGGYAAVDLMFKGIDLTRKKLLDVGSGIGGMAHYLAQKHHCYVTGLDIYPKLALYSNDKTPADIKNRVHFVTYPPNELIPLPSKTFDIIYSKGVLTNVEDKKSLFCELFRLLKPSGQLCLIDWIVPNDLGPIVENLTTGEPSYKETEVSYHKLLMQCGFTQIIFEDQSQAYLDYVKELGERLVSDNHKKLYSHIISDGLRKMLICSNEKLQMSMKKGAQLSVRIKAQKL
ncbi:MAG: methyltransferase domain-containing protein [Alphaproteobacteria bacterium]|nr:methyltransferase domain-containing protein [Alphaproteobacteria bacterium]